MTELPPYPVFLRLDGRLVLVVGGGSVAARKIRLLLNSGARINIVSVSLNDELKRLVSDGSIAYLAKEFDESHLDLCCYVVAATDDAVLNRRVARSAETRNLFVNVVDDIALSSAIAPAVVHRPPLAVAISSSGAAPVLVRRLREQIEQLLPANLGSLARFISRHREVQRRAPTGIRPRDVWERFLDSPGATAILCGDEKKAEKIHRALEQEGHTPGEVYLVGAGPGSPDLLTLRALQLMQNADVVLYDRLVGNAILDLVRRDAERVFVGKRRSCHALSQADINQEMIRRALAGQRVLRLKGGDPFMFGRGGEEIAELAAHGIIFQVVPGVTAASGCAAYAGIPLTHRDYAQTCIFVTGHPRADGTLSLPWEFLARSNQTVVIYMGLASVSLLCKALRDHGLAPDWPAALIERGTLPDQRVIVANLSDLPQKVVIADIRGPSTVIVGEVVRLKGRLQWFRYRESDLGVADACARPDPMPCESIHPSTVSDVSRRPPMAGNHS